MKLNVNASFPTFEPAKGLKIHTSAYAKMMNGKSRLIAKAEGTTEDDGAVLIDHRVKLPAGYTVMVEFTSEFYDERGVEWVHHSNIDSRLVRNKPGAAQIIRSVSLVLNRKAKIVDFSIDESTMAILRSWSGPIENRITTGDKLS